MVAFLGCGAIAADEQKLPYQTIAEVAEALFHNEISSDIIKAFPEPVLIELRMELKKMETVRKIRDFGTAIVFLGVYACLFFGAAFVLVSTRKNSNGDIDSYDTLRIFGLSSLGGACGGAALSVATIENSPRLNLRNLLAKIDETLVKIRFGKPRQEFTAKEAVFGFGTKKPA